MGDVLFNRHCLVRFPDLGLEFGGHIEWGRNILFPHIIEFQVEHKIVQYPNEARVRILNISRDKQQQLTADEVENTPIEIEAGYWPPDGAPNIDIIFIGKVRSVEVYRLSDMTTIVTEIACGDGDEGYQWARMNKTFLKGENDAKTITEEAVNQLIETDQSIFLSLIDFGEQEPEPEPRATTVHQKATDTLNDISRRYDMHWQIQDGGFEMFPKSNVAFDQVLYEINKDTGMVGTPRITDVGVNVVTLLLPRLRPGRVVDVRSDTTRSLSVGLVNGLYRIEKVNFSGTLGGKNPFYAQLECRKYEGEVYRNAYRAAGEGG